MVIEIAVNAIIAHRANAGKATTYKVAWSDGTKTFVPASNLYDEDDGDFVFNDHLLAYWNKYPQLRERDGF